ncbi:unnamed protein product [Gordionus sp. m RMFG-2023]
MNIGKGSDFGFLYQMPDKLDIEGKVNLKLTNFRPRQQFDRYLTFIPLLDMKSVVLGPGLNISCKRK